MLRRELFFPHLYRKYLYFFIKCVIIFLIVYNYLFIYKHFPTKERI